MQAQVILPPKQRRYLAADFKGTTWSEVEPYFRELIERPIHNVLGLEFLIRDISELEAALAETRAWTYIATKQNTSDVQAQEAFMGFIQNVYPPSTELAQEVSKKIVESPFTTQLGASYYQIYLRLQKNEIELFRSENVELAIKVEDFSSAYFQKTASFSIEHEGNTYTLPQAAQWLEKPDRSVRQTVWGKIEASRAIERENFQQIFDELIKLRHQIAQNAGFSTYTNYAYAAMERFDYQQKDVYTFHETVEKVIRPIYQKLLEERKKALGVSKLRPWDLYVNTVNNNKTLKPFHTGKELIEKTIALLQEIRPEMAKPIQLMYEGGFLDVESRLNKAPGGFNYPLFESGLPFIFMNATGSQLDVTTMLHESGHAIHSYVTKDIAITRLKNPPIEVAELASMSMELLALNHYHIFYEEEADARIAKKEQLLRSLMVFPWIAAVDSFQHWIYDNPNHTHEQRNAKWVELYHRFHGDVLDWSGHEAELSHLWIKQLHIFEHPFYYIEYAFSQLGAMAVRRNYEQNPNLAIDQYLAALKLGYTQTLPDIYKMAGISFDFSYEYVKPLMEFFYQQYQSL